MAFLSRPHDEFFRICFLATNTATFCFKPKPTTSLFSTQWLLLGDIVRLPLIHDTLCAEPIFMLRYTQPRTRDRLPKTPTLA
jgi:hypothetical protein